MLLDISFGRLIGELLGHFLSTPTLLLVQQLLTVTKSCLASQLTQLLSQKYSSQNQ